MVLTLKFQNAGNHHCLLVCHPETEKSGIVFRTSCQRHSVSHITCIARQTSQQRLAFYTSPTQAMDFCSKQHLFMEIEKEFSSLIGMFYSSCVTHCSKLGVFSRVWCINCWSAIHHFHSKFLSVFFFRTLLPGFTKAGKWGGGGYSHFPHFIIKLPTNHEFVFPINHSYESSPATMLSKGSFNTKSLSENVIT